MRAVTEVMVPHEIARRVLHGKVFVMELIRQVEAYVASHFPGADLMHPLDLVYFPLADARGVVREHRQDLADDLFSETCWLIVVGNDPRGIVSSSQAERREIYYESDYDSRSMRDQWFLEVTGAFDLEKIVVNLASAIVLIASASGRIFDYLTYAFYAWTPDALCRCLYSSGLNHGRWTIFVLALNGCDKSGRCESQPSRTAVFNNWRRVTISL